MARTWMPCTTSIDLAQQQQYNTTSLHGVKRSLAQASGDFSDSVTPRASLDFCSAQALAKRQCMETGGKARLLASKICSLENESTVANDTSGIKMHADSMPGPSQNALLSLAHPKYGLSKMLVENFTSLGINSIYPWQSSCLLGRGLLDGSKNLVYAAPTGGGKSLVADVLMLKRVIEDPTKKAILVLPYVALVQEKLKWLRKACEGVQKKPGTLNQCDSGLPKWRKPHESSIRVVGFFGGSKARATWSDVDIAVCTIEKVAYGLRIRHSC